jgi:redox-sensitive bicupin YhaK (pirin superfamily)
LRTAGTKLFGIQSWVALTAADEETDPEFVHYDASYLPVLTGEGKAVPVIAGEVLGARSPVHTSSPMFYADVQLEVGASLPLDAEYEERAIYTVSGIVEIAGDRFGAAQLLVFAIRAVGQMAWRNVLFNVCFAYATTADSFMHGSAKNVSLA